MPRSREFEADLESLEAAIDTYRDAVAAHACAQFDVTYHGASEELEREAAADEAAARAQLLRVASNF